MRFGQAKVYVGQRMSSEKSISRTANEQREKHMSTLDGEKVNKGSISCKKIRRAEPAGYYLTERRLALLS